LQLSASCSDFEAEAAAVLFRIRVVQGRLSGVEPHRLKFRNGSGAPIQRVKQQTFDNDRRGQLC
ncbi:hypothetical protein ACG04R_03535, partial [Roseateles sp. BYS78W]